MSYINHEKSFPSSAIDPAHFITLVGCVRVFYILQGHLLFYLWKTKKEKDLFDGRCVREKHTKLVKCIQCTRNCSQKEKERNMKWRMRTTKAEAEAHERRRRSSFPHIQTRKETTEWRARKQETIKDGYQQCGTTAHTIQETFDAFRNMPHVCIYLSTNTVNARHCESKKQQELKNKKE